MTSNSNEPASLQRQDKKGEDMPRFNTAKLESERLADFERDGYLVIPQFFTRDEMSRAGAYLDEFAAGAGPRQVIRHYERSLLTKKKLLSRIEYFADFHPGLGAFVHDEGLVSCISQLMGEPAVLFKEKAIYKLPGGGGFAAHQDMASDWVDYADYFLTAVIAVDECTAENGCLEFARAQHKRGLITRRGQSWSAANYPGVEFEKYSMQPGDVILFDSFVPHQSEPNLTSHSRRVFYFTFNRASAGQLREKYFATRKRNLFLLRWLPFLFGSWRVTDKADKD